MMTLVIVLAEITVALIIILIVVAWKAIRARSKARVALNDLVTSIHTHQSERREKLTNRLKSDGQLSDDDALATANALIKKQNRFYQDIIDLYINRNNEMLSNLDHRLDALIEQHGVIAAGAGAAADPAATTEALARLSADMAAMSKNIEDLRAENGLLHDQLKAAEQELDQLGREYISAFNRNKASQAEDRDGAAAPLPASLAAQLDETATDQLPPVFTEEPAVAAHTERPLASADLHSVAPLASDAMAQQEQGLLADLDLIELVGKDAGPSAGTAAKD